MSAADIRKLRRKFIGIAMISLLLVMIFIGLAVNLTNYFFSRASIRKKLEGLASQTEVEDARGGGTPTMGEIFSPEFDHNRYYVFTYGETEAPQMRSNAMDASDAEEVSTYAAEVYDGRSDFGKKGSYFYLKTIGAEGHTVIAFLNCASEISTNYRILILTLGISVFALGIMFLLVYRFSAKMIEPEIENNRRQKEFITNASHELKTPLAVIRANIELLELTQGENEWTRSSLAQIEHVDGLIKNLVMIAKSEERENDKEEKSEFDVSLAVEQTTDTYEALAKQTGKTLKKRIAPNVRFVANEAKIRQLTTILLDNAMKYCDEEGMIEVSLSQKEKGGIVLCVSNDYAEGATVDYKRFFDRFYRKDAAHTIDKGGYGIGLSIAESICQEYHGTIEVDRKGGMIAFVCRLNKQ